MENKIDREIRNDEYEELLEEQFLKESEEIEAGLSASVKKQNAGASFIESLEKRKEGYDRLITRLRETGKYREENTRSSWNAYVEKIRKEFEISRIQNVRVCTYAKMGAAAMAVLLSLLMGGMLLHADLEKVISMLKIF